MRADASVCLLNSYLILSSSAAGEKPLRTPIPRTPQTLLVVPVCIWHHALPLGQNEAQTVMMEEKGMPSRELGPTSEALSAMPSGFV